MHDFLGPSHLELSSVDPEWVREDFHIPYIDRVMYRVFGRLHRLAAEAQKRQEERGSNHS